jgi:hypothetical protein
LVIRERSAFGKVASQLGDAFAMPHEVDFGETEFLALGQVT